MIGDDFKRVVNGAGVAIFLLEAKSDTNIFVSQSQWTQSTDDKGIKYYYLKDGSKCQWTLPEVCVWFSLGI